MMAQGNPYGPRGGRWPTATKLRALYNDGRTYDEIAQFVFRTERGWDKPPSRSGVKRYLDRLGFEPRKMNHSDLVPWRPLNPEHADHEFRHMLQAEGRRRALKPGEEMSDTDRKLVSLLNDMLYGRGKLMVIGYDHKLGFYLTERTDEDDDIIRRPRTDVYSDPGIKEPAP